MLVFRTGGLQNDVSVTNRKTTLVTKRKPRLIGGIGGKGIISGKRRPIVSQFSPGHIAVDYSRTNKSSIDTIQ